MKLKNGINNGEEKKGKIERYVSFASDDDDDDDGDNEEEDDDNGDKSSLCSPNCP